MFFIFLSKSLTKMSSALVKCQICDKEVTRHNINAHLNTHDTSIEVKCPTCQKTFRSNNALGNHRRKTHPEPEMDITQR